MLPREKPLPIATGIIQPIRGIFAIDEKTIEAIQSRDGGDNAKVINLIKSIEKTAEEQSEDPYLIAMADRARAVQESFEDRQTDTAQALSALFEEIERKEKRKRLQVERGLDGLTYYVLCKLTEEQIPNARFVSEKVAAAFRESVNWRPSEKGTARVAQPDYLRHLRRSGRPRSRRFAPNHGKLWKSLMRAHLGDYEICERKLRAAAGAVSLSNR